MTCFRLLCVLGAAFIWAGCDGTGDDYSVTVDGLVYDETLNRPAEGVTVVMAPPSGWFIEPYEIVAQDVTDADGRYQLEYDPGWGPEDYRVQVNFFPFDSLLAVPGLSAGGFYVRQTGHVTQTTRLYRYATLRVRAETDAPPSPSVSYSLEAPGRGRRDGPITTSVRANAFSEVRIVVTRDGVRSEMADSVYCPLGLTTEYVFRY